jgi:hypothetical protein
MTKHRRSNTTESTTQARTTQATEDTNPLYGVAMLKIALELKRSPGASVDEVLGRVLTRMRLDETEFRAYLGRNGGLLRSTAPKKKLHPMD